MGKELKIISAADIAKKNRTIGKTISAVDIAKEKRKEKNESLTKFIQNIYDLGYYDGHSNALKKHLRINKDTGTLEEY